MAKRGRRINMIEPPIPGVTVESLNALLDRHGLEAINTLDILAGEIANPMLRINDRVVVRLNQHAPDTPVLAWEALIYHRLRQTQVLSAPMLVALDTQRDVVPYDALILDQVEGVRGNNVWAELDAPGREALSEELGRLCGAIHSLPWLAYGEHISIASSQLCSGRWADIVFAKITHAFDQAAGLELLPLPLSDTLITVLNDGDAVFETAPPPALAHTSLRLSNILLKRDNDRWSVGAIIDWQHALVADPVWEFAEMWSAGGDVYPLPDPFLYGYKERHPLPMDFRVRLRLYRLLHNFERFVAAATRDGAHADSVQVYRTSLQRMLART